MSKCFEQLLGSIVLFVLTLANFIGQAVVEYPMVVVALVIFYIGYRLGRR